jgi:hypothetical protein
VKPPQPAPADQRVPVILIGRCTNPACRRPYRIELPGDSTVWANALLTLRYAGAQEPRCDCRAATRCPEQPGGLPECLDWDCTGHAETEVKFRVLKVTYKSDAICGPGNCWGDRSSTCTCSCRGRNHGGMWAIH